MSVTEMMDQVQAFAATGFGALKHFAIGMVITIPFVFWLNLRERKSHSIWTSDRESAE
jgi:hypothetical protein